MVMTGEWFYGIVLLTLGPTIILGWRDWHPGHSSMDLPIRGPHRRGAPSAITPAGDRQAQGGAAILKALVRGHSDIGGWVTHGSVRETPLENPHGKPPFGH